jgi:hypothetical protein
MPPSGIARKKGKKKDKVCHDSIYSSQFQANEFTQTQTQNGGPSALALQPHSPHHQLVQCLCCAFRIFVTFSFAGYNATPPHSREVLGCFSAASKHAHQTRFKAQISRKGGHISRNSRHKSTASKDTHQPRFKAQTSRE